MAIPDSYEKQQERQAFEKQLEKARVEQLKADITEVMALPSFRRILSEFMMDAGTDNSPLRTDIALMAAAIGWQDAAGWWMNLIRRYCPERESQMRAEAKKALKSQESNDDDN